MQDFLDIAFSFPTVVFTVSTILFLGFWTVTSLIGAGADAFEDLDFDFDADTDIEIDPGIDTDLDVSGGSGGSNSLLRSALEFLGITNMPLLLALNLESLFAWLTSVILMTILGGADGFLGGIVGIGVLIVSFLAGVFVTTRIGRRWAHVFRPTHALRQRELVGSVCTVTTERVSGEFGQAEVRDAEGSSLIVQVRCTKENDLTSGDRALIFDLDTDSGVFTISPDKSLAH